MPVPLRAPVLLLAVLALPPSLPAAASPSAAIPVQARQGDSDPQPLVDLQTLLKALEGWMKRFPTYGVPEVLPNGDIIIRRHTPESPPRKPTPPPDGTET